MMLFITLFSSRRLAYVKLRIGENRFGGESVTYMSVSNTKKWEWLESYGPKFVENIVQAIARDILCYAMQKLKNCSIVAHIYDEIIIEADKRMSVEAFFSCKLSVARKTAPLINCYCFDEVKTELLSELREMANGYKALCDMYKEKARGFS